jgi:hypothetical protein
MGRVNWGVPIAAVDVVRNHGGIRLCVETGTYRGASTELLAARFDRVITIEASPALATAAERRLSGRSGVQVIQGDSSTVLPAIVTALDQPALFWLDSHYCGPKTYGVNRQCPVIDEIHTIVAAGPEHVVLIDDARLFLEPPPLPLAVSQWPSIGEICAAFAAGRHRRYLAVHDDVIFAVPESLRPALVDWFVRQVTQREHATLSARMSALSKALARWCGRGRPKEAS